MKKNQAKRLAQKLVLRLKPYKATRVSTGDRLQLAEEAVFAVLSSELGDDIGYAATGDTLAVCLKDGGEFLRLYLCTVDVGAHMNLKSHHEKGQEP